jgi:Ca-activated chloride channel homolog
MRLWGRIFTILGLFVATVAIAAAYPFITRGRSLLSAHWESPSFSLGSLEIPIYAAVGAVVVLVVLFFGTIGQDRRRPSLKIASVSPLARGPKGIRSYLRDVPGVLRASALVFLVGALCRPILETHDEKSDDKGIDIIVVMDLSGSMRAVLDGDPDDVPGAPKLKPGQRLTRIDTAKAVVEDFIGRRKSDRIGVVVFGKSAFVLSPPTLDYHLLSQLVSRLTLKVIDDSGTAIGDALMAATARLRRSEAQSKVIILLTDGDNNAGEVAPEKAAEIAKKQGCKVFAIQIGNGDQVDVEDGTDLFGNPRYVPQRFPVNPELLKRITETTGGQMYVATDLKQLANSMHSVLDQLEKTRFEAPRSSFEDLFQLLLIPGVILVGLDVLLRALLLRRFP